MASHSPELNVPDAQVKQEVLQEGNATANNNATTSSSPPATTGAGGGLTKRELELMTNIIHRISNYRDKEYVPSPCLCDINHAIIKLIPLQRP